MTIPVWLFKRLPRWVRNWAIRSLCRDIQRTLMRSASRQDLLYFRHREEGKR